MGIIIGDQSLYRDPFPHSLLSTREMKGQEGSGSVPGIPSKLCGKLLASPLITLKIVPYMIPI